MAEPRRQPHRPRPKGQRPSPPAPREASPGEERQGELTEGTRLQKLLAQAGVASRRGSEELIRRGLVTVDGRKAVLGERVDPARNAVEVEGRRVVLDPQKHYFVLNKPEGVITTTSDPEGRPTVLDMVGIAETVLAEVTTTVGEARVNIENLNIVHSPEGGRGRIHLEVNGATAARMAIEALQRKGFAPHVAADG
ncbi:MAG: hypothetical protein NVSMB32_05480 [Actinomycetota bacterium]